MKNISIDKLARIAELLKMKKDDQDKRKITYLRTYPHYLCFFKENPPDEKNFSIRAGLVYSWMPHTLVLDFESIAKAVECLKTARTFTHQDPMELKPIADALNGSYVGMSKLLHFENPEVFPIFDTNVYRFIQRIPDEKKNLYAEANKLDVYVEYCKLVHDLIANSKFDTEILNPVNLFFTQEFKYSVTPVRAAEFIMFASRHKPN